MLKIVIAVIAAAFVHVSFAAQQAKPASMPEGKAKPMVEGICSTCHALQLISNSSGYTREHWKELVGYMIDCTPEQMSIGMPVRVAFKPLTDDATLPVWRPV